MNDNLVTRTATAFGLLVLCAISVLRVTRPPSPVPATAPDTVFSAERAMHHVEAIAVRPHPMGSADHDRVRDYIMQQLTALGIKPQLQVTTAVGTRYQAAGRVQNILAWMPGKESNGKALLLAVHYDGVEAGPAAGDDAAGSAALLETLRALRARKEPLAHDVIAIFTDGEEAGLLGAAAFVREHPWAKDVAFVLNFEARGTSGRSYMFETGPGNRDAASLLRSARDVTAGSTFTTVYRTLPNDTDLSEFAVLGVPALNFAFADGVERYHTSHDDVAHLNPGSVQHHGLQMLALAKKIGDGPLPRPRTGDGVFFDMPALGMIVYPVGLAIPLALVALVLTVIVIRGSFGAAGLGAAVMLIALLVSAGVGRLVNPHGPAMWSGLSALAIALIVVAINAACYRLARTRAPDAWYGALVIWLVLCLVTSIAAPGVSYLFTWPLLFALIAARSRHPIAMWAAAAVTILILAGLAFSVAAIMLGVSGTGAISLAVVVSLVTWLLVPLVEQALGTGWRGLATVVAASAIFAVLAAVRGKPSPEHPVPTALAYVENPQASQAWLGTLGPTNDWTRAALGAVDQGPAWTGAVIGAGGQLIGKSVRPVGLEAPTAALLRDTLLEGARRVVFRVNVPTGTTGLTLRALGAPVVRTAIDGKVADTTRFRRHPKTWAMLYWAVPDSGAVFSLAIPVGAHIDVEMAARSPGLPAIPGVQIPPRPNDVVPAQVGDVKVSYAKVTF
ncbi:MAG TPA: M28 family peptidase [Gemmatimonadaceae bacterium]